jgi:hypothetical protein
MELDSVREVKATAKTRVIAQLVRAQGRSLGIRAEGVGRASQPDTIALGISKSGPKNYVLAVRIQHPSLRKSASIENLRQLARGEVDVQYVGAVKKRQVPWYQTSSKPLRIGCSIGHVQVTAGTLGAFVKSRQDGSSLVLSNNHVLANENVAAIGDHILQPGRFDGGQDPADKIGTLSNFIPLDFQNVNHVDCATALIDPGIPFNAGSLDTFGNLSTPIPVQVAGGETVMKIGRTTGSTQGKITAIEVDNVGIGYDHGQAQFDGQIEIEGSADLAFSQGGDSGSLIFDQNLAPVALLFAGSDQGGTNGMGLTFGNPLQDVLNQLTVDLQI